jgi:hypothetical protein
MGEDIDTSEVLRVDDENMSERILAVSRSKKAYKLFSKITSKKLKKKEKKRQRGERERRMKGTRNK